MRSVGAHAKARIDKIDEEHVNNKQTKKKKSKQKPKNEEKISGMRNREKNHRVAAHSICIVHSAVVLMWAKKCIYTASHIS